MVPVKPFMVGIAGGSCSGKSTLAEKLAEVLLPAPSFILNCDRYYRSLELLPVSERPRRNFDSPEMIDTALLEKNLRRIRSGLPAELPVYDFQIHARRPSPEILRPPEVVLVEGLLLFVLPGIPELFDLKVYVEARDEIRLARRMERDKKERGRTEREIREIYFQNVLPAHRNLVEPSRKLADMVVDGESDPESAAREIAGEIMSSKSPRPGGGGGRSRKRSPG